MIRTTTPLLVLLVVLVGAPAHARQRPDQIAAPFMKTVQELLLNDGSRLYGAVESEDDVDIVFRTTSGALVRAPKDRIVSMRPVTGRMMKGDFRREDPNNTRLLFGPTGKTLRKGETYLGVYEFMMPFVQVGITDRISIGGGTPLFFAPGANNRPYWVTPKVSVFSNGGTHVSAGLFHAFDFDDHGVGVAYGVMTRDVESGSFTIGAGMGYTSTGERGGVVMVSADGPVRRNMKVITENYLWRSTAVVSLGVRFFGDNLSADLALGVALTDDGAFGAPVVNFVYRF
jgi:hypothetical protein